MRQIEISEQIYEYLNSQAVGFELKTPNDVLEKIFNLNLKISDLKIENKTEKENPKVLLYWKGIAFPEGLQLRFKGRPNVLANVKDGKFVCNGFKSKSPSRLAGDVYGGTPANGWVRWEYLDIQSNTWKILDSLRAVSNESSQMKHIPEFEL